MGTAGAKAFGDMLLGNKTMQTLDVSDNSFGKPVVGDQVKLKSSGEMKVVIFISKNGTIKFSGSEELQFAGKNKGFVPSSEYENGIAFFCTSVAASPSLISVSTTFRHALAVIFLTPPLIPPCIIRSSMLIRMPWAKLEERPLRRP